MNSKDFVKIAWYGKHFGEEPPLVGDRGAGTIFFTGCNLKCVYCQNYQISQQGVGKNYSIEELAKIMIFLEEEGALNIDLVTPTAWSGHILEAIKSAKKRGLKIPIVWNSNAYESLDLIKKNEGFIDIYLPDFKYGDNEIAFKYSGIKNYVEKARESIKEMLRQVGNLKLSKDGIAEKGIIVRHLIISGNVKNSLKVIDLIKEIDVNIHLGLMTQYEPIYKAKEFPEINRRITKKEFEKVYNYQLKLGLDKGWVQEMESPPYLLPDFTKNNPFDY